MKERTPQDQIWNDQKDKSTELNRLLASNVFYHGQFWRKSVMARKIISTVPSLPLPFP